MTILLKKIIYALVPLQPVLSQSKLDEVRCRCFIFVKTQISLAPFHIRFGLKLLISIFYIFALLRFGPFVFENNLKLEKAFSRFTSLNLPVVADFDRALRSMTLLSFMDDAMVLSVFDEQTTANRHIKYRKKREQLERVQKYDL